MKEFDLTLSLPTKKIPVRFAGQSVEWVAEQISGLLKDRPRLFVIADATVALLYEHALREALTTNGFEVFTAIFEPGERHKHLRTVSTLLDQMAERRLSRDDVVIGLGGGVTTDMAGFVASIYARGFRWIAAPTSLLGMVDAAIGGKTGVDHPLAKNLIGTFHQPLAVFAPLKCLDTLPPREWKSGSAEVVKSALLAGGEFWKFIEAHGADLHDWPRKQAYNAIARAAEVKIEIVAKDERESDLRRLLNLGHTFGHALEVATSYRTYSHGEAIFLGLRAAIGLSHAQGLMSAEVSTNIDDILAQVPLPRADVSQEDLLYALGHDKKVRAGALHWILLKRPGESVITPEVSPGQVQDVAEWVCEIARQGTPVEGTETLRILILNGPNLNLLGEREPELYGHQTYAELETELQSYSAQNNIEVLIRQSNVEGDLVSLIQSARHWANGIIINPGGYTHTSVAIRDALAAVTLPVIEVHLTDIQSREEFRRISLISPVCTATISGHGTRGYLEAMEQLKHHIKGIT